MELTVYELKERDPKRFEKEHYKWQEYALWDDWYEPIWDDFKAKWAGHGLECEGNPTFSIGYSQGDGAAIDGWVDVAPFMKAMKMDEQYPALYLAAEDYGVSVRVEPYGYRGLSMRAEIGVLPTDDPVGIFADLDEDTWAELVEEQKREADIEGAVKDFADRICDDLYHALREESEYLTSEESFMESCGLNDITFEVEDEDETCD